MSTSKFKINGVDIEVTRTPIEMPWGSVYWLVEAHMERPIAPQVFRRVGELSWTAIEPTSDAACDKLQQYIENDLAEVRA